MLLGFTNGPLTEERLRLSQQSISLFADQILPRAGAIPLDEDEVLAALDAAVDRDPVGTQVQRHDAAHRIQAPVLVVFGEPDHEG